MALIIVALQDLLLGEKLSLGILSGLGMILMFIGVALHVWTGKLLGWKALVGYSELKLQSGPQKLVKEGPFSVMRHPTYFAHTLMFLGVFLMTGFMGTGFLVLTDFVISYFVIIPLEERELLTRFGGEYRRYKESVPKFLPRIRPKASEAI